MKNKIMNKHKDKPNRNLLNNNKRERNLWLLKNTE